MAWRPGGGVASKSRHTTIIHQQPRFLQKLSPYSHLLARDLKPSIDADAAAVTPLGLSSENSCAPRRCLVRLVVVLATANSDRGRVKIINNNPKNKRDEKEEEGEE